MDEKIGQRLLLAFHGKDDVPDGFRAALKAYKPAGVTLFRSLNIENPRQVRELTKRLQAAALEAGLPPLLIAVDQEGGQLMAIGNGTTPLPGNMALGATRDRSLARRAGEILGTELRAMGVNVNYAPSCDVNINPHNPAIGIRSFGEDPLEVGEMASAMIEGMQSRGVAATAKHFPGHGDVASDSHYGLPMLRHDLNRLQQVEFPPFQAAIRAKTKLIMTAHLALPAIDGPDAPPATLSPTVLKGLLRSQLGFDGVIITDAMDMQAIPQGAALGANAVRAAAAGADLLLLTSDPADQQRVFESLRHAAQDDSLLMRDMDVSLERIASLKHWLTDQPEAPALDMVGCAAHQEVADEIARRSMTLVRNEAGLLPLRSAPGRRVAAIVPKPSDLTPADTSSYVAPTLAAALRAYHPQVDELSVGNAPSHDEIAELVQRVRRYDLVVLGTLNAFNQPDQQALVSAILGTGIPTVLVAMRLPYDLASVPEAQTTVCTYSILEPSMRALAAALSGVKAFEGQLPVSIPGLYPAGFGIGAS
ncbi:MAG TPA: glycoside hydrolase family 3 N-terminal domain-containing protein [Anaerolineales bacterium]